MDQQAVRSPKVEEILNSDVFQDLIKAFVNLSKLTPDFKEDDFAPYVSEKLGLDLDVARKLQDTIQQLVSVISTEFSIPESDLNIHAKTSITITHNVNITAIRSETNSAPTTEKRRITMTDVVNLLAILSVNPDQILDNFSTMANLLWHIVNMLE